MSKKPTKAKQFSFTPRLELAPLKKSTTEWDLKGLYYKNETDPQIEKDIVATETAYRKFIKKWRKRLYTLLRSWLKR